MGNEICSTFLLVICVFNVQVGEVDRILWKEAKNWKFMFGGGCC